VRESGKGLIKREQVKESGNKEKRKAGAAKGVNQIGKSKRRTEAKTIVQSEHQYYS